MFDATMYEWVKLYLLVSFCMQSTFTCTDSDYLREVDWRFKGENIARNKPASHYPATYKDNTSPAELAVDGNCNTDYNEGSCSHTDSQGGISTNWTVEFGSRYNLTGIIIYNRASHTRKRLRGFHVTGDCDQNPETSLYNDFTRKRQQYNNKIIAIPLDGRRECSSITIQIPEFNFLTLCEVLVYALGCSQSLRNGYFSPSKTWYAAKEQVTIQCNEGYYPSTNQLVTCFEKEGIFVPNPSCDRVTCQMPSKPENGYYLPQRDYIEYGTIVTGKCNEGFKASTNNNARKCMQDGTFSGEDLICVPVTCAPTYQIRHGSFVDAKNISHTNELVQYNTVLIAVCDKGYRVRKNEKIVCGPNGQWEGDKPVCDIVTCQAPKDFDNGFYKTGEGKRFEYNAKVRPHCNIGFILTSHSIMSTCAETGKWVGELPVCTEVKCQWPLELNGGRYNTSIEAGEKEDLPFNSTITAICDVGYIRTDAITSRRCLENGTWSGEAAICTRLSSSEAGLLTMILWISTLVATFVIIVIAVMLVIVSKRKCDKRREYSNRKQSVVYANDEKKCDDIQDTALDHTGIRREMVPGPIMNPSEEKKQNNDTAASAYYCYQDNENIPKTAIKLADLSDIILSGDSAAKRFEREFEALPNGMLEEYKVAQMAENVGKNRYKNLFAFDHSRVVLETETAGESDYINASFVDGYKKARAYIASQGPAKEILGDFWRMVWLTNCGKIVMLTNLIEENKSKCAQYWPEEGTVEYSNISVTMNKSESFSDFVIRKFTVKKRNSKARHVTQFHFTAWPDKGVPKYASSLVQFRNKVKYTTVEQNGPIIVHCSAGVGRTGTFVALDYLTDQANDVGYVDVFGSVAAMRRQRVNFVQTLEQYIFVHRALVETLMLSTSALPSHKFPQWYQSMLQIDPGKKQRKLDLEFQTLSKLSPSAVEDQYSSATEIRNRQKNRYLNILPVEAYMPRLEPLDDGEEDTTYINAVYLPSYKEKKAFIITQTPLKETIDDFWRLVWEHEVQIIVMMNNTDEMSNAEKYWPKEGSTMTSNNIKITHTNTDRTKQHLEVTLALQKYVIGRTLTLVQCRGWQTNEALPDSVDVVLSLVDSIQKLQRKCTNKTLLIHCMNGADKSGLFCIIFAVLERLKIEQDVAINQVIEEMRNAREQIIPSVKQYEFCHKVVFAYIEELSTYSNFT